MFLVMLVGLIAGLTAHVWFGVPVPESAALGVLMWPVVDLRMWPAGVIMYAAVVALFGGMV